MSMTADARTRQHGSAAAKRREKVPGSPAALAASVNLAKPFPKAAAKIMTLTSGQDFDVRAIVGALETDVALSTRVLRLVNSPTFGLRVRCATVKHAVTLLGSQGVRHAAVTGSVLKVFPGNGLKVWRELHHHAMLVGGLCRHLAHQWDIPQDEMFTAAFLHDIGKWTFLERDPEYAAILEEAGNRPDGTLEAERARYGYDHADLAFHLLSAWGIPAPLPQVVGLHHDPTSAYALEPGVARRVALIRVADQLAHILASGENPDFEAIARSEPFTYLGLSAKSIDDKFAVLALLVREGGDKDHEEGSHPDSRGPARLPPGSRWPSRALAFVKATDALYLLAGVVGSVAAYEMHVGQFMLPLAMGATAALAAMFSRRG